MRDGHVGQLAGLNADIRADHGIRVAIIGSDVVGAFRQQRDISRGDVWQQRSALAYFKLAALVDRERDLVLRDLAGADAPFDAQSTSRKQEGLPVGLGLERHGADRAD